MDKEIWSTQNHDEIDLLDIPDAFRLFYSVLASIILDDPRHQKHLVWIIPLKMNQSNVQNHKIRTYVQNSTCVRSQLNAYNFFQLLNIDRTVRFWRYSLLAPLVIQIMQYIFKNIFLLITNDVNSPSFKNIFFFIHELFKSIPMIFQHIFDSIWCICIGAGANEYCKGSSE